MQFRLREGFTLFKTVDEAADFQCGGARSGVTPLLTGGQAREFRLERLAEIRRGGKLGMLEPLDSEARAYFGDTKALISRVITNPELFVPQEKTYD